MEESTPPPQSVPADVPLAAAPAEATPLRADPHAALLDRVRLGDHAAFSDLYDATSSILYSLALRILRSEADAEETILEAYTRAWRLAPEYTPPSAGSVLAWLTMMTRSLAIDRLRANAARGAAITSSLELHLAPADPAASPESAAASTQLAARVRHVLSAIPDEQRAVLTLAYFHGLSQSEIAAQLGVPFGTVKTRARLGMARMRDLLEELR